MKFKLEYEVVLRSGRVLEIVKDNIKDICLTDKCLSFIDLNSDCKLEFDLGPGFCPEIKNIKITQII